MTLSMEEVKPYLAVFVIQALYAGLNLLSKAIFNGGMNTFIFNFYRQATGTLLLLPLSFIFQRRNETPLSALTLLKIFMLALLGITLPLNAFSIGLKQTSATLGAAAQNCQPVSTFFFALLFRMEKVRLRTIPGIAKVAGVVICIAGVATLTLYKGPYLKPFFHHQILETHSATQHHQSSTTRWVIGCLLFLVSILAWSLWSVLQEIKFFAEALKSYPEKLSFASLQCLSSAAQCFVVAIAVERDLSQWKLGWNMRLLTVVYSGIFLTSIAYYLQVWVIEKKGPVFQAMSQPLTLVMTMIGSVLLLGEAIPLGSALGGILLVISLYAVLWGKSKEQNMENQDSFQAKAAKEHKEHRETEATTSKQLLSA